MLNDNYLVKKTTPLIYAEWASLGINELKIIEIYLSRIDIKNGITSVKFSRNEFANLMGYADSRNLKTKVFDERLSKFMSQQIRMDLDDGKGYHLYTLFSDAKCYYDKNSGMAMVEIDCNSKLAPVFLDLADGQNNGYNYISYRVEKTKNLKSTYSIKLYNLLLHHCWGNYKWVVELDEFRRLVGATEATYQTYKFLNAQVIKKAQKELAEHTDIKFEYERITSGRKTTGLIFKIQKRKETNRDTIYGEAKEITNQSEGQQSECYDKVSEKEKQDREIIVAFREQLEIVNAAWKISDAQILEIGNRLYNQLPMLVFDYNEFPQYKKDLIWMNYIEDMLRKAFAENAKYLYRYITAQWERYIVEISARID